MPASLRWTSADLESLPDDRKRYEIVDGELYLSKQPHWYHQVTCSNISFQLQLWNRQTGQGQVNFAPGIIFAEDDDVAPDVVWISNSRVATALEPDGKLHSAPELVVEVLVEVYRGEQARLGLVATLFSADTLNSPLLPGFACPVAALFERIPTNM
jgi:Uma2 family endonuclease